MILLYSFSKISPLFIGFSFDFSCCSSCKTPKLCKLKLSSLFQETMYIGSVNIEGERQGYGQLTQKNGLRIEGFWKEGTLNGWGRVTNEDGQFFEGFFTIFLK